jgi:PAS domain-containing protein
MIDANRAWAQLFGFEDEAEMPGLTFMDLFTPERPARHQGRAGGLRARPLAGRRGSSRPPA